jgi:hypothetical protein
MTTVGKIYKPDLRVLAGQASPNAAFVLPDAP